MVITVHIDRWVVPRILIDNGSQVEILFQSAFEKMGYDKKQLKKLMKPLYGFGGKRTKPTGVITLPVSFSTPKNHHTEHIILDVADMPYPYNAIFGLGLLNTYEAALHSGYLCLKIPATFGVITKFGCQKKPETLSVGLPRRKHAFPERRLRSIRATFA
jgi:hypothetical protein